MTNLLTTAEAARLVNRSEGTIRQRILRGKLNAMKKGKTWLITEADLKRVYKAAPPAEPRERKE